MKKTKRILSFALALLMGMGVFSGLGTTAFAASSEMTTYMVDLPRGGDPNQAGWSHPALHFMGGWSSQSGDHFSVHTQDTFEGKAVYCIEPGVGVQSGDRYGGFDESFWDNYPSSLNPTIPPAVVKAYIGRIMQYGWQGNADTSWNTGNSADANEIAGYIATQLLVWETVVGERDSRFNHVWGSSQGKNNVTEYIADNHPLRSLIFSRYADIESSVQRHTALPSFFSASSGAGAYELKWNGTDYSVTLTDTNGVLGNYRFSSNTAGLDFSVSGNKLTIRTDKAVRGAISVIAEKTNGQRSGVVVWSDGNIGGGQQDFATYGATVSDPVTGYLNLEIKTGNMKLIKTSEDGKVEGIRFTFVGEGFNATKTTGANGVIDITDLNPGIYTVTEQAVDKYEPQAVQRVTIVSGQTSTVTFNNKLKRGDLKVTKTSEDGLTEGMKFHLYGTSLSGLAVDEYAVTDQNGVAKFENVLISGSKPFTLEEVDTPIRYVIPEAQTASVEWNKVTGKSVQNILKKFRVTVTKSDVETGLPQGDASLAGATYGIYKGDTLIDSYTTDSNGQFTTGYYICDADWSVREINPSEGYLIDGTVHHVGAEPELYTIELNTTANDVTEQVIKGNIALIKHTDNGDTQIETPESGAEFRVFLKSAGSYDSAKETERDVLVCDENGFAQTKDMPYGVYTVRQTKGWDGRELMKDFDVYIAKDGQTYRYLINNTNFESYIKIVKVDAETGKTIPYAGAGFQLYDPEGNRITQSFTYPTPTTIDTFYTNDEGYLITPEKLEYGTGYSLVEVFAPYGYVLSGEPVYFDVVQDNSTDESGVMVIEVTKPNMAQKGVINISKSGEVFSTVTEAEGLYQPVYTVQGLPGAVYEITAAEDIITLDGTLRAAKGEVVDTVTTGEDGLAVTKELYLGKYEIREITAPDGMVCSGEIHEVELVYAGQEVEITETATSFYNERQKVQVTLEKLLEQDEKFGIGMNGELAAVTFGLYATEDITAADGSIIPAGGLLEIVSFDENGHGVCKTDLPFGSYYLKEIASDSHYLVSDEQYPVVFEYAGQDTALVEIRANDGKPIENKLLRGEVEGIKKDEDGKGLGGAVIGLFKSDETEFTRDTAILTATSGEDGSFSFANVPYGTWLVREIEAPTGFVLSDEIFTAVVDEDGAVIEVEIENILIRGNVQLTKVDKDYSGKGLATDNKLTGAEFEVYRDVNDNKELDDGDELLGKLTETAIGVYGMTDLTYGGYFVKEAKAPESFQIDENAYYFEIAENGKTVTVENEAGKGFTNMAQTGSLKIIKTSSDGKVEGFSFRVTGPNGYDQTFITDKNGEILMENLRIGEYTVTEVANGASASYVLPADKQATVKVGATTVVTMHNELRDTPKTGDDSSPTLWLVLMGAAAAGAVTLGVLGFKKRRKDEE
ncbi:MAG: SpaA isopeptide-forming pilin-related protein [Oscillospiraceae bacterium]|nr:SpaA isopeptide-forming pilin-related protein [Oscillospiraceae bacterium]